MSDLFSSIQLTSQNFFNKSKNLFNKTNRNRLIGISSIALGTTAAWYYFSQEDALSRDLVENKISLLKKESLEERLREIKEEKNNLLLDRTKYTELKEKYENNLSKAKKESHEKYIENNIEEMSSEMSFQTETSANQPVLGIFSSAIFSSTITGKTLRSNPFLFSASYPFHRCSLSSQSTSIPKHLRKPIPSEEKSIEEKIKLLEGTLRVIDEQLLSINKQLQSCEERIRVMSLSDDKLEKELSDLNTSDIPEKEEKITFIRKEIENRKDKISAITQKANKIFGKNGSAFNVTGFSESEIKSFYHNQLLLQIATEKLKTLDEKINELNKKIAERKMIKTGVEKSSKDVKKTIQNLEDKNKSLSDAIYKKTGERYQVGANKELLATETSNLFEIFKENRKEIEVLRNQIIENDKKLVGFLSEEKDLKRHREEKTALEASIQKLNESINPIKGKVPNLDNNF